jgi:hypothetical protein
MSSPDFKQDDGFDEQYSIELTTPLEFIEKLKIDGWLDGKVNLFALITSKSRVTPSSKSANQNCTPRSEMRGLLLAARLLTSILPGL